MFSFGSKGQFCMAIQGRALFKNNLLFPGDNASDKCVQCQRISPLFRNSDVLENFEYYWPTWWKSKFIFLDYTILF